MKNSPFLKIFIWRIFPIAGILLLLGSLSGFAQTKNITGKVFSDSGTALAGISVRVKGTNLGTVTAGDGSFSIAAVQGSTLEFSGIGYSGQSVKVETGNEVTVRMSTDTRSLNEVVVVGYGTVKRKDLTGSVSSISADQIEQVPVVSVEQALQGRASGVQVVNNDGTPGGNISVLIRGIGSLASGGNTPLYVVDGYPLSGGINNINPNDISSIDILKDASATAIYGIRAANGVVIVTTKKGRKGMAQVSLDAYWSFQSKPKQYNVLNAQQWATLSNQVADADSLHNFVEMPIWRSPDSLHNLDWQNALYQTGLTQNYSIGVRGGSDKIQGATSVGYFDQKGIVEGSYFKRVTMGINLDYNPVKWLRGSASAYYTYQDANNPFGTGSLVQLSELPPTMDNGNLLTPYIKDGSNYGFYNPKSTYVAKYGNPLYAIQNNQYKNLTNYFLGNASLEATLLPGLRIKTLFGINTNNYNGTFFQPEDNRINQQYNLGGATQNAYYSQTLNSTFEWVWENTIAYDKTFGLHGINFVGGMSAQENTVTGMGGHGIPPNSVIRDLSQVTNLVLDPHDGLHFGNGSQTYSLESYFARLTYMFDNRYIITGTIRYDGSSKFDEGNKYGTFPSGAIAWKAKNESFMKDVDWLTDLKFRGSYGEVGNQTAIAPFGYQALYSTGLSASNSANLGYPFNKIYQRGYAQTQPANPNLKWETDVQTDIGMDAVFLHGNLSFTVDWFKRNSKDFLLTLAAPAQSGYNNLTRNVGSMENVGWEFAVNYSEHNSKDFTYNIGLTVTTIKNTLTSITSGTNFVTNFGGTIPAGNGWSTFTETNIGQPVGEFYGYKTLGIFQSQAQIDDLNKKSKAQNPLFPYYQKPVNTPGDRYFQDTNGDGHVDGTDQVSLGSPQPKFYGSLNLNATYKNWDFNAYFYGVYGNKICNYVESALESFQNRSFVGVENVSQEYYANHWTPSNPSNRFAKATYNDDAVGSNVPSSTWIEDGSFLKLKNFSVGYTLPASLIKKWTMTRVRLYVSAQNLFTITSYTGLDPEIGIQGGNATQNGLDNGTYPSSHFYTVGLNLTF